MDTENEEIIDNISDFRNYYEIERGIKWMRENKGSHDLSDSHIDLIEEELTKNLRK